MAGAERVEELAQGDTEGMSERVPGPERADGTALLDLDESAAGQATMGSELVITPATIRA